MRRWASVLLLGLSLVACARSTDTWASHQDVAARWGQVRPVEIDEGQWEVRPYLQKRGGRHCIAHRQLTPDTGGGGDCFNFIVDVREGFGSRHRLVYAERRVAVTRVFFTDGTSRDLRLTLDSTVGFRYDIVDLGSRPVAKVTALDEAGQELGTHGWREGTYP